MSQNCYYIVTSPEGREIYRCESKKKALQVVNPEHGEWIYIVFPDGERQALRCLFW